MPDITITVFVLSIVAIGLLLTATIRRDFINKTRLRRQAEEIRARRRPTGEQF